MKYGEIKHINEGGEEEIIELNFLSIGFICEVIFNATLILILGFIVTSNFDLNPAQTVTAWIWVIIFLNVIFLLVATLKTFKQEIIINTTEQKLTNVNKCIIFTKNRTIMFKDVRDIDFKTEHLDTSFSPVDYSHEVYIKFQDGKKYTLIRAHTLFEQDDLKPIAKYLNQIILRK
ncbi:MAG: hypothetical protein ACFFCS_03410 [Candidatus Hodarchaeota archaeon]